MESKSAIKPSDEQHEAINSTSNKICILACAGSGKTFTITRRIARAINDFKIEPSQIAAITFTNLATNKLKLELSNLLSTKPAVSQMFIGTIHAFCLQLLKNHYQNDLDEYNILSENKQFVLLNRFWHKWDIELVSPEAHKATLIEKLVASFDIIKMERIDLTKLCDEHAELHRVFQEYQQYLRENNYWDYADLISKTLHLFENDTEFKNNVFAKYKYLFVDEYQDVDPSQAQLINYIGEQASLCVVGDDDQSIYQFRGTDVENIIKFANGKKCQQFVLSENRRCPQNILDISNNIIQKIKKRTTKTIKTRLPKGHVEIIQFPSINDETSFIIETIKKLKKHNLVDSYGHIAILMRSVSSYGNYYIDALKSSNIPHVSKGARTLFETSEVSNIVNVLEWMIKEPSLLSHLYLLRNVFTNTQVDFDAIKDSKDSLDSLSKKAAIKLGLSEEDYNLLSQLSEVRERYYTAKFGSLLEIVHEVISILGLFGKDNSDSTSYNVAMLTQSISEYEEIENNKKLQHLCGYFQAYARRSFDEATPIETAEDAVNVLTVHQAKGLEFDYVFIPMLVEKRFPVSVKQKRWLLNDKLFNAKRYYDTEENERRLFYVAITRAKKGLYLLCSKDVGLTKPKEPSLFFREAAANKLTDEHSHPEAKSKRTGQEDILVTSYSSLEYYLTCPYRYKLIKVYGIALQTNPFFEFGKIIHAVLSFVNSNYGNGNHIEYPDIEKYYNYAFDHYFRKPNLPAYVVSKQRNRGLKIISNYFEQKKDWLSKVHSVESDFEYIIGRCLVKGRYDLMLSDKRNRVHIIDFKTGHEHPYLRTDFQMQIYALAGTKQLNLPVEKTIVYYLEDGKEVPFNVTDEFIDTADKTLTNVIDGILSKDFHATPGKVCTRCEVKLYCNERITDE